MRAILEAVSDHLLVALTLAFALGIAVALLYPLDQPLLAPLRLTMVVLALFLLMFLAFRKEAPIPIFLTTLFLANGFVHSLHHLQPPIDDHHLFYRIKEKREAVVVGTLLAAPEFDGKLARVRLDTQYLRFPEDPALLPTQGTLLLHLASPWPTTIQPGDLAVVRADLKRPDGYRSPGAFDYPRHLALQGVFVSCFCRSPLLVHKLDGQGFWQHLRFAPERARMAIGQFLDQSLADPHRALYRAILIGDASAIDDQIMESFKGSGTIHILSISGLHLTIIGTLLYGGVYWLLSRSPRLLASYPLRKWAAFVCLPALIGYGFLAGLNIPVFRAMVMSCLAIFAICGDREKFSSTLLALAALLILAIDPPALALPSFQLSFAATAAILFLVPALKTLVKGKPREEKVPFPRRFGRWLTAGLLVSAAATAITAPLTLHAFNRASLVGIIANLVVEPLICLWSLPCGFLALSLAFFAPEAAAALLHLGAPSLSAAVTSADFFANLPYSSLWRPSPPFWLLAICGMGFFGIIWGVRVSRPVTILSTVLFALSLLTMLLPLSLLSPKKVNDLEVTQFDVGQGSATLLRFPSGGKVLIDGGGPATTSTSVGERVIAPYLWRQGILAIDALIITHPDADHFNGLAFILTHFSPKLLWVRDIHGHDEEYRKLLRLAEKLGVAVRVPHKGEELPGLALGERLSCLVSPATTDAGSAFKVLERDNSGLLIKTCVGPRCALFPGDIDSNQEQQLVAAGIELKATLLLSPHHGSASSNSKQFLATVAPEYLLVSAGRGGRGHFPHANLPESCRDLGISLLTTQEHGTLVVDLADEVTITGNQRPGDNPFLPYQGRALPK